MPNQVDKIVKFCEKMLRLIGNEFSQKFHNKSLLERVFWLGFFLLVLWISTQLDIFWFGLVIVGFLLFAVIIFDKEEIPFTIVSLFFALVTYNVEHKNYLLEHRSYLEADISKVSFTNDGKMNFVFYVQNDSNYLAKNVRVSFGFHAGNIVILPTIPAGNPMAIFPHTGKPLSKNLEPPQGVSLPQFSSLINDIKNGKTDLVFDIILEYDGEVGRNFKTIETFEYYGGSNNTINALNVQVP